MEKILCTVEILTRNSARTLGRCLGSVKDFDEIIILDGNSTDNTRQIAERFGCKIIKQYDTDEPSITIKDYAEVRNKGLALAKHDWFMYIDSDEYLSSEVAEEIREIVTSPNPSVHAYWQPRKYVLSGTIIDCATTYPNRQMRLFHRQHINKFIRPIHERIELKPETKTGFLKHFEYVPVEELAELEARWGRYMKKEIEMLEGVGKKKLLRLAARYIALFCLYTFRYIRNLIACRGNKMPLRFEIARHKYLLLLSIHLLKKFITGIRSL